MDQTFWNSRYQETEFAYGKTPNLFIKAQAAQLKPQSQIICLAEGEGRNAVYLSSLGHQVSALDFSIEGLKKTTALAKETGVAVTTIQADLKDYTFDQAQWDVIVLVFAHFPKALRTLVHGALYAALKPGGKVILQAYEKKQLDKKTGGPQSADLLYSIEELKDDFSLFKSLEIAETVQVIKEGKFHDGESVVLELLAFK